MSNERKDGGSAFPQVTIQTMLGQLTGAEVTASGMSLRDYFAGLAMQGMFAGEVRVADPVEDTMAQAAYRIADAMLKAREQ